METLGEFLQKMRQERGMTLEEVASQTRISLRMLKALEANDFSQMPNEVSVRGFIRSYARCLRLNEGEVFKKFRESAHDFYAKTPVTAKSRELSTKGPGKKRGVQKLMFGTALLGAAVVFGIAFYQLFPFVSELPMQESVFPQDVDSGHDDPPRGETSPFKDQAEKTQPYPVDLTVNIPGLPPPQADQEASSTVPGPQGGSASGGEDLTLVIEAAERSWILAEIDEHLVKEVLLQPGEKIHWRAKTKFVLTLGNAGGVKLKFNGKTLEPSGPMGRVVRNIVLRR